MPDTNEEQTNVTTPEHFEIFRRSAFGYGNCGRYLGGG